MKNRTLLLAAALIFAISPMIANANAILKNTSTYTESKDYYGVSSDQIYQYMLSYGFHVDTITPIAETTDVYVTTMEKKNFILHIENNCIIGIMEDQF